MANEERDDRGEDDRDNDSDFGGNETGCNCDKDVVFKMLGRFCSFYHYILSNGDNLKF